MTTNDQRIAKTMQSLGEAWVIGGAAGAFLTMLVIEFELIKNFLYKVMQEGILILMKFFWDVTKLCILHIRKKQPYAAFLSASLIENV